MKNPKTKQNKNIRRLKRKIHPIKTAINVYLHGARDIETGLTEVLPLVIQREKEKLKNLSKELRGLSKKIKTKSRLAKVLGSTRAVNAMDKFQRLINSRVTSALKKSLFLGLFSSFDAFTGDLLESIYLKKPELFNSMEKNVPLSEVLKFKSFDELKKYELKKEIEIIRRKSYVEQFEEMEKTFQVKLKDFEHWPQFVEATQRRNLVTHCNGIVTEQYMKICKKEGVKISTDLKLGAPIGLKTDYLLEICNLMMEVSVKLGLTLWRKIFPKEVEAADHELNRLIYEILLEQKWALAEELGKFGLTFRDVNDLDKKFYLINRSLALKFSGKKEKAIEEINTVDWSAAMPEFKLAKFVILEKNKEAAEQMEIIGKESEFLVQESYHLWPLFREYRKCDEFLNSYKKIYGHPFSSEVRKKFEVVKSKLSKVSH